MISHTRLRRSPSNRHRERDWTQWATITTAAVSSFAAVYALVYASEAADSAREQIRLSERGQVSERFDRAVEQLSSTSLDLRLGGIYALDRMMHDYSPDVPTVVEVLSAYVRRRAVPAQGDASADGVEEPTLDVQTALTVLGRRPRANEVAADLTGARLANARLQGLNFVHAQMTGADLRGADLKRADLTGVSLDRADLRNSNLGSARLTSASLRDAWLNGAQLIDADLTRAVLTAADLRGASVHVARFDEADLNGANLSTIQGANRDQFRRAFADESLELPAGVARPERLSPPGRRYFDYVSPAPPWRAGWYIAAVTISVLLLAITWVLWRRRRRRVSAARP